MYHLLMQYAMYLLIQQSHYDLEISSSKLITFGFLSQVVKDGSAIGIAIRSKYITKKEGELIINYFHNNLLTIRFQNLCLIRDTSSTKFLTNHASMSHFRIIHYTITFHDSVVQRDHYRK